MRLPLGLHALRSPPTVCRCISACRFISVGFQQSAVLPKNTSYAQPALFFFDGPGADGANTEAGPLMPVRLNGVNLGALLVAIAVQAGGLRPQP